MAFVQVLEEKNFCPATAMIECYQKALAAFEEAGAREAPSYLSIASSMAGQLASYAYPKLKAIDNKNQSILKNMSNLEKLEALKEAQKLLEAQIKEEGKHEQPSS